MSDKTPLAERNWIERYWLEPPPEPSARLLKWQRKVQAGWVPNRRIRGMGYYSASEWFGVYIWEYLNVLYPLLYGGDNAKGLG